MGIFVDFYYAIGDGFDLLIIGESGCSVQDEPAFYAIGDQKAVYLFDQVQPQDDIGAFGDTVIGADRCRKEIDIGLFDEFEGFFGLGVKLCIRYYLVLSAFDVADFTFYQNTVFVRQIDTSLVILILSSSFSLEASIITLVTRLRSMQ
jgi:hypothetical protein